MHWRTGVNLIGISTVTKKNSTCPIIARITVDGIKSQFNTKLELTASQWNVELGRAQGKSIDAQKTNSLLEQVKSSIHQIYHELLRRDNNVTSEKVKNEFLGINENHETLLSLFQKHNDNMLSLIGVSKSKATYQKYEITRKHLADFIRAKYHLSDISVKEINHMFLTDFEVFLKTACKCGENTTAKFMQFFKRIIIIAKNNGWITNDPFANYKIRLKKVDRGYLTQEEIGVIMQKKFSTKRLEQVRDIFVFSCFCGLATLMLRNFGRRIFENHLTAIFGLWVNERRPMLASQSHFWKSPRAFWTNTKAHYPII